MPRIYIGEHEQEHLRDFFAHAPGSHPVVKRDSDGRIYVDWEGPIRFRNASDGDQRVLVQRSPDGVVHCNGKPVVTDAEKAEAFDWLVGELLSGKP